MSNLWGEFTNLLLYHCIKIWEGIKRLSGEWFKLGCIQSVYYYHYYCTNKHKWFTELAYEQQRTRISLFKWTKCKTWDLRDFISNSQMAINTYTSIHSLSTVDTHSYSTLLNAQTSVLSSRNNERKEKPHRGNVVVQTSKTNSFTSDSNIFLLIIKWKKKQQK